MDRNFDFNKIGKQMPYTVPEGFFDQLQTKVMEEVAHEETITAPRKVSRLRTIVKTIMAAAAVVGLFFMCNPFQTDKQDNSLDDVDQAFQQLSQADQNYLLQVYQDDVFINE